MDEGHFKRNEKLCVPHSKESPFEDIIANIVVEGSLRLVRSVRELLGNAEVRIVLLTGQPGMSDFTESIDRLDEAIAARLELDALTLTQTLMLTLTLMPTLYITLTLYINVTLTINLSLTLSLTPT